MTITAMSAMIMVNTPPWAPRPGRGQRRHRRWWRELPASGLPRPGAHRTGRMVSDAGHATPRKWCPDAVAPGHASAPVDVKWIRSLTNQRGARPHFMHRCAIRAGGNQDSLSGKLGKSRSFRGVTARLSAVLVPECAWRSRRVPRPRARPLRAPRVQRGRRP